MIFVVYEFELGDAACRRLVGMDPRPQSTRVDLLDPRTSHLEHEVPGGRAVIPYRYGDGFGHWALTLTVEGISEPRAEVVYPRCLAGTGSAPEEDLGDDPDIPGMGVFGIANPDDEADFIPRYGPPDDPPPFDPRAVVFDDPADRWRWGFADRHVVVGDLDSLEGMGRLPDRRYPIPLTAQVWETLTLAGLTDDARIRDRVVTHGSDRTVLHLTLAEAVEVADRVALKLLETWDVRLQRKLNWIHGSLMGLPELLEYLDGLYDSSSEDSGGEDDL
jgi:hypothetical protein